MNSTESGQGAAYPRLFAASVGLGVLMVVTFTALLDRYLISLLVPPIRATLQISDTQVSLLQGFAFALFYSIFGIPFGRLVDRSNRRNIILVGLLAWSLMTIACGLARDYPTLFVARVGVGIGEACLAPAAYSLLTDLFHPRYHGRVLAAFTLTSVAGGGASFLIGAEAISVAETLLAARPGLLGGETWRLAFILVGLPGIPAAALMLMLVREPARKGARASGLPFSPGAEGLLAYLRTNGSAVFIVIVGAALASACATGVISWMPTFLARSHGLSMQAAGRLIGTIMVPVALIGGIVAGWVADTQRIASVTGEKLWMQIAGCALALPFGMAMTLAPTPALCLALFAGYSVMFCLQSCSTAVILQDIVPNHLKGQVSALFWLCVGIVGLGGGPTLIALVTDRVLHSDARLSEAMLWVMVPTLGLATIIPFFGRGAYQRARARNGWKNQVSESVPNIPSTVSKTPSNPLSPR